MDFLPGSKYADLRGRLRRAGGSGLVSMIGREAVPYGATIECLPHDPAMREKKMSKQMACRRWIMVLI